MKNTQMRKNVELAMKSLEIEDFVFTDFEKSVFEKVALGEITTAQAREIFKKDLSKKYGIDFSHIR